MQYLMTEKRLRNLASLPVALWPETTERQRRVRKGERWLPWSPGIMVTGTKEVYTITGVYEKGELEGSVKELLLVFLVLSACSVWLQY